MSGRVVGRWGGLVVMVRMRHAYILNTNFICMCFCFIVICTKCCILAIVLVQPCMSYFYILQCYKIKNKVPTHKSLRS